MNENYINVKLNKTSIAEIMEISIELNKQLVTAIIEEMKKVNYETTLKIIHDMKKKDLENERLYNLKQLAKILNINYRTLQNYNLPYESKNNSTRKFYRLSDVRDYLQQ